MGMPKRLKQLEARNLVLTSPRAIAIAIGGHRANSSMIKLLVIREMETHLAQNKRRQ
jgi:hypothetical protein